MVGNQVEQQAETVLLYSCCEVVELLRRPECRVQVVETAHVVTMRALRASRKDRGGVNIRNPQFCQIRNDFGRLRESKMTVELQTVRGPRHALELRNSGH